MSTSEGEDGSAADRQVGSRLRTIRHQNHLSLLEVEAGSGGEFKASVLGAYERADRAITVDRLQRLARFYNVPVDQLLPITPAGTRTGPGRAQIAIDLARLDELHGPEYRMLGRYLRMIQVQRHDFNGRVLTIRHDYLYTIACILDTTPTRTIGRLTDFGLRYHHTH